jgi:rod shape-determining protein MreC
MEVVAARVMSKDLVSDHNTLQINKGTHHGLKAGQAVITVGGVVGYVFKPGTFTSQVLLITDRYSVVDGIIARSRARGIVEGKNASTCVLRYVEKSEDVQPGDLVVTSGLDNIFPKGFPVAKVEAVENKTYSVSLKVELKPVVDPDKIEEVFVIMNAANEDMTDHISMKE